MKRLLLLLLLIPVFAFAAPPYDITVTFSPPTTGGAPVGYNFYVDDCAITGPVGAPVSPAYDPLVLVTVPPSSGVFSGKTYPGLIVADGTYQFCVRAVSAAGEQSNPGQVATAVISDLPLPGPVNNLGIQVTCPTSNCTINVTIQ